jgi:hypothetical protein
MANPYHDNAAMIPTDSPTRHAAGDLHDARPRRVLLLLGCLLALRLILSVAYSLATPLGEAPDEADHFAYAAHILERRALPVGPEMTQGKHPPLYHIAAALAAGVAGGTPDRSFLRANPDMSFAADSQARNFFVRTALEDWPWREGVRAMRAGRCVSILAGLILVVGAFLLSRAIWPARPFLALAAAAFAAFLPESLFIAGAMSNDMFAAMWSTLALWLAVTARSWKGALLTGICLGLAFVSKASTGSLAIVAAAALFVNAWPRKQAHSTGMRSLLPAFGRVAMAGAAAFALAAPWLSRNWQLYGDPFGWSVVLATIDQRQGPLTFADVAQLIRGWWLSFWGKFGGAGHIPLPTVLYIIWAGIGVLALTGWLRWWWRRRQRDNLLHETSLAGWIVLLGAPLVTAVGIYSYSKTALGTDQGRLLFPALAPLSMLIVAGLAAWPPRRRAQAASLAFSAGMALLALAALITGLIQPYAPPPQPTQAQLASATSVNARFGPVELAGSAWQDAALTLFWRAAEPTREDLRTVLRVLDSQGNLLWEWKRSPGAGRFSTDRWPAGRVVSDTYRIPADVLPNAARVEVGVRPFPEGPFLTPASGDAQFIALPLPPSTEQQPVEAAP